MKKLCLLLIAVLLILCSACSNSSLENAGKELGDSVASAVDSNNKYVLMVKNGYRENNPTLTYDKAFSAFFGTPRWKYFKSDKGQDVVEFTGDCTYQDVAVKARMQFVVDEKKGTFEAAYLAFNEVPQNAFILSALITKAFEDNKNDSLKKSSESPAPGQTATKSDRRIDQKNATGIEQEAVNAMYGTWGEPNTDHILTITKDSYADMKYDVLETETVAGSSHRIRIKIHSKNPFVAKIMIEPRRGYNWKQVMEIWDETNNRSLTEDSPLVRIK